MKSCRLLLLACLPSFFLVGCHMHLIGTKADYPAAFVKLTVTSENPDSRMTQVLKNTLRSRGITLTDKAKLKLHLTKVTYQHSFPSEINAGKSFNTTATMTANYTLRLQTKTKDTDILKTSASTSETLLHNANQVNTSSMDLLFRRLMTQRLADSIFFTMTSKDTLDKIKEALYPKKQHQDLKKHAD